eukprot:gnl/TRDRNA2_/TRDRNA2_134899_c0_seq1.p1 gnl/TRDRNA2_/TRDRNA2_134899_c0~~gnl/TRDRNA2_/TRDRNA2_134899_c0_seq1.p1  ORF type:complete len:327 (+),score=20.20 gnl/TRDRNA2_/TRDRNA2_134899_c0_seq1:67-981(+)
MDEPAACEDVTGPKDSQSFAQMSCSTYVLSNCSPCFNALFHCRMNGQCMLNYIASSDERLTLTERVASVQDGYGPQDICIRMQVDGISASRTRTRHKHHRSRTTTEQSRPIWLKLSRGDPPTEGCLLLEVMSTEYAGSDEQSSHKSDIGPRANASRDHRSNRARSEGDYVHQAHSALHVTQKVKRTEIQCAEGPDVAAEPSQVLCDAIAEHILELSRHFGATSLRHAEQIAAECCRRLATLTSQERWSAIRSHDWKCEDCEAWNDNGDDCCAVCYGDAPMNHVLTSSTTAGSSPCGSLPKKVRL